MIIDNEFKRIFLITVDCLRADVVGCIGGGNLTPYIDRFAQKSLLFERAFANGPGTNQSFPAILTSTYFLMHGGMRLSPRYTTLAEVLRRNGFKTVGFHSNPFLSKILGWDRGFDEFYDYMGIIKSPSAFVTQQQGSGLRNTVTRFLTTCLGASRNAKTQRLLKKIYYHFSGLEIPYLEGKNLNNQVSDWIEKNLDQPFFLWMHYMDPHYPYIPPEPFLKVFSSRNEAFNFNISADDNNPSKEELETFRELYNGEVRYTDNCIGKMIEFLESKELLDDSLVVFTADHGHAFMEHGRFGHAYDILYNEVLHVPLLIYGLGFSKSIDVPVELLSVPPTITDIFDLKKPQSFMGASLTRQIEGREKKAPIISESANPDQINLRYDTNEKAVSCILGDWKLIVNEMLGSTGLYDIRRDFGEKNNVATDEQKKLGELKLLIQKHFITEKLRKMGPIPGKSSTNLKSSLRQLPSSGN